MKTRLPLSKSRFGVWERCPFYASMVYERKIKPPRSKTGSTGVVLHDFRAGVLTGRYDMDDVLALLDNKDDRDALVASIAMDIFHQEKQQRWELDLRINGKGLPVKSRGILRGILDRFILLDQPLCIVEDVKFGAWWVDDLFERRSYALLAISQIAPDTPLEFHRVWPKLGKRDVFSYQRTGSLFRVIEDGEPIDLWDYLQKCVLYVQSAQPIPSPGPHCENWYGQPCYFLNNFCPITQQLPVAITPEVSVMGKDIHRLLNSTEVKELGEDVVASAYGAALQMKGLLTVIEARVQEWCDSNGDLKIGSRTYGWRERVEREVDKEFVLKALLENNLPLEEAVKAINISASSIKRLPQAYKELRASLLDLGTWVSGNKRVFGGHYG